MELALFDPATNSTDVLWSSHMVNEPNPKWGEKFDFTMISATSRLNITVWDKLNFFEGRFSLKGLTGARELAGPWPRPCLGLVGRGQLLLGLPRLLAALTSPIEIH